MRRLVLALALVQAFPALAQVAVTAPAVAPAEAAARRIQADVETLASEQFHGRRAGTADADAAAAWIQDSFKKIGLLPGAPVARYLQPFEFIDGVNLGP